MTAPAATTLIWMSLPADSSPDFDLDFPAGAGDGTDIQVGDVMRIQYQAAGGSWSSPGTYYTRTITASDLNATTYIVNDLPASALADGSYDCRARFERGAEVGDWSNIQTILIDTTGPIGTLTPLDNATNVNPYNSLKIVFNETVRFGATLSIAIKKTADDSVFQAFTEADISGSLSITGNTSLIIDHNSFDLSTGYYVTVSAGAVTDIYSNPFLGISGKTAWNFTSSATVPTETFRTLNVAGAATVENFTVDIGATDPNRVVCILLIGQATVTQPIVTVGGVTLACALWDVTSFPTGVFWAQIPTGTTGVPVSVDWRTGSAFQYRAAAVWTIVNLNAIVPKVAQAINAGAGHSSVPVDRGDVMMAIKRASAAPPSWSSSTQVPSNSGSDPSPNLLGYADWSLINATGNFSISPIQFDSGSAVTWS